ncbi:acyl-CoA carboxylase subunit epsilon [Streptomyces sp. NPDC001093]|uniref:acyl-CoA carboxylase subunit epsilon n=1 Tax=Streptomyces sp. NPDC001093 TaxID=3154376 RepID=UPI00332E15F6
MTTVMEPADQRSVRVERGTLSDEELAALTAVLLTRAGTGAARPGDRPVAPVVPGWERPERNAFYRSPLSWQS